MLIKERVFRDDHHPTRLLHREQEVAQVLRAWEPAVDGNRPGDLLIYGPSGVGKSTLATHCGERLVAEAAAADVLHVRCVGETTTGILRRILADARGEDVPQNVSRSEIEAQLDDCLTGPTVVILDEADDVPETDILRELPQLGPVGIAAITHTEAEWLAGIDENRTRSRFTDSLRVQKFGVGELADILDARARVGLADGAYKRSHLEYIADAVAGVARRGIQTLREAALEAQDWGAHQLHREHIDIGIERADFRIRQANLDSLPFHHQLLYELVRRGECISGPELHDRYDCVADRVYQGEAVTPIVKRVRRDKLEKLEAYDLIRREGETRDREYEVIDERVTPSIDFDGLDELVPSS